MNTQYLTSSHRPMLKPAGFSLVEVMVVVAVLAIMMTIGVPNLVSFLERNRVVATANDLLGGFQLARSEAVRLNTEADICPSADGSTCSGSWADGWIVRRNDPDTGWEVIRVSTPVPSQVTVTGPNSIQFESGGNLTVSALTDEFSFAISSGGFSRCLTAIVSGRAEVGGCGNG